MGLRYAPYVFTEQGVAMLSSVLNSPKAIAVNIRIIRVFTKIREMLTDNLSLTRIIHGYSIPKPNCLLSLAMLLIFIPQKWVTIYPLKIIVLPKSIDILAFHNENHE